MSKERKQHFTEEEIRLGLALPLMEEFYSIQGEGFHTGKPAYFCRIGGCDVGCKWCDVKESWNAGKWPLTPTDNIIRNILANPSKSVVITGGEPLQYNLDYLCEKLKKEKISLFLETSGSYPLSGDWDWICLSPKKQQPPLKNILLKADELKVIVEDESDLEWAEEYASKVRPDCRLYLQPEWSKKNKIIPLLISYVLQHPEWSISLQTHKYLGIP